MDDINTPQLTKLQMYCSALYNIMDKDAVAVTLSDSTEVRVWRGLITETAASVGAGEGVYSRVIDRLTILGRIAVLDRGRRNNPSTVALHFPPTGEVWARMVRRSITLPIDTFSASTTLAAVLVLSKLFFSQQCA